jgi:hypothetical protein
VRGYAASEGNPHSRARPGRAGLLLTLAREKQDASVVDHTDLDAELERG